MPNVVIYPEGKTISLKPGENLLEGLRSANIDVFAPCAGKGWCGKCAVIVEAADPEALSTPTPEEIALLGQKKNAHNWRLACQVEVRENAVIRIPVESRQRRWIKEKTLFINEFQTEPVIRLCQVVLPARDMHNAMGWLDRVVETVETVAGIHPLAWSQDVKETLLLSNRSEWARATFTLRDEQEVVHVQPGFCDHSYGVAIDIGTTTLAVYLCDLVEGRILASGSALNPQVTYGADIVSRIAYAQTDLERRKHLQKILVEALNSLIGRLAHQTNIRTEDIIEVVLVGNSVMHHLVLGLDPSGLGKTPFNPVVRTALDIPAVEIGLKLAPTARLHVLPLKAGYVGADAVAAVLGSGLETIEGNALLMDMGTNGEIILKHGRRLFCTSVPLGPVFEGAQITLGMRADIGAVEHVRYDPRRGNFQVTWIGQDNGSKGHGSVKAKGFCGSAVIEIVAEALAAGLIRPDGRIVNSDVPCVTRADSGERALEIVSASDTYNGLPLLFTQKDVRAVQLAKGASSVGIRLLLEYAGLEKRDLARIFLGGIFGTMISPLHALALGILPPVDPQRIRAVGNVAGAGACMALLNRSLRQRAVTLVEQMEYVSLPQDQEFQDYFIEALQFSTSEEARHVLGWD
ncbi:MAG: ASKHA domain-containing protein [Thermanaerothrix sp.]|uniref:ASKHA domain-containing protein n=1 Tax=Thermanaerothrix sp. TaxID=2972675 RepID=UPI003C7D1732